MAATAASRGGRRSACPVQVGGRVDIEQHAWIIHLDQAQTRLPEQSPRALVRVQQRQPRQQVRAGIPRDGRAVPDATAPPSAHVAAHPARPPCWRDESRACPPAPPAPSAACRARPADAAPPWPGWSPCPRPPDPPRSPGNLPSAAAPAPRCPAHHGDDAVHGRPSRRALATATHGPCGKGASSLSAPAAARRSPPRRQQDAGTRGRQVG